MSSDLVGVFKLWLSLWPSTCLIYVSKERIILPLQTCSQVWDDDIKTQCFCFHPFVSQEPVSLPTAHTCVLFCRLSRPGDPASLSVCWYSSLQPISLLQPQLALSSPPSGLRFLVLELQVCATNSSKSSLVPLLGVNVVSKYPQQTH